MTGVQTCALPIYGTPATDGKITTAIEAFLREVKATKSAATYRAYGTDLEWFQANITKQYFGQVTRQDILRVFGIGRDQKFNQKTINRRILVGVMALRNAGAVIELKKGDWPRTSEKGVEIYEREELEQFFKACDPDERLLFQTFLCTGFRARELSTLCWADVDFKQLTITVRPKPVYGFTPKSYEERSVSVPVALINTLKGHYKAHTGSTLVFPTRPHPKRPNYGGEAPDAHHLELCKEIAYRAKLNCGRCKTAKGMCIRGPHCAEWYLHKWRHTFATNMIQSGVDIKTLQSLLGHKNIATTEKYLKGLRIADLQQKIENSSLAAMLA